MTYIWVTDFFMAVAAIAFFVAIALFFAAPVWIVVMCGAVGSCAGAVYASTPPYNIYEDAKKNDG